MTIVFFFFFFFELIRRWTTRLCPRRCYCAIDMCTGRVNRLPVLMILSLTKPTGLGHLKIFSIWDL